MSKNYTIDFALWNKKYNQYKQRYENIFEKKSDLLLLNRRPTEAVTWPAKVLTKNTIPIKPSRKKRQYQHYVTKPYDPLFRGSKKEIKKVWEESKYRKRKAIRQQESREYIDLFLNKFLNHDLRPKPVVELSLDTKEFIKDESINMLDKIIVNIANMKPPKQEEENEEKQNNRIGLDWEFVLGNLIQVGLPPSVIDRVKRRMAIITGKDTPAITALNVTRPRSLSDLTIPSAEVEAQEELKKLIEKYQKLEFKQGDEPFKEDMEWLIELDKKDQYSKDKEMERIHQDYTNRVLDLKPAFF